MQICISLCISPVSPEQEKPSPLKPSLQTQRYEPGVFIQLALGLQLWSSVAHSSRSEVMMV